MGLTAERRVIRAVAGTGVVVGAVVAVVVDSPVCALDPSGLPELHAPKSTLIASATPTLAMPFMHPILPGRRRPRSRDDEPAPFVLVPRREDRVRPRYRRRRGHRGDAGGAPPGQNPGHAGVADRSGRGPGALDDEPPGTRGWRRRRRGAAERRA